MTRLRSTPAAPSFSRASCAQQCARRYYFDYEVGLRDEREGSWQQELGRIYHAIFEAAAKGEAWTLAPLPAKLLDVAGEKHSWESVNATARMHLREMEELRVLAAEMDRRVTLPNGQKCTIVVDLVHRTDEGLEALDWKTTFGYLKADYSYQELSPQGPLSALAVQSVFGEPCWQTTFVHLCCAPGVWKPTSKARKSFTQTLPWSPWQLDEAMEWITRWSRWMQAKEGKPLCAWPKSPSFECGKCPHLEKCKMSDARVEQELRRKHESV